MARGERLKRFDEYLEEEIGRRDLEQRKNNFNFICHYIVHKEIKIRDAKFSLKKKKTSVMSQKQQ